MFIYVYICLYIYYCRLFKQRQLICNHISPRKKQLETVLFCLVSIHWAVKATCFLVEFPSNFHTSNGVGARKTIKMGDSQDLRYIFAGGVVNSRKLPIVSYFNRVKSSCSMIKSPFWRVNSDIYISDENCKNHQKPSKTIHIHPFRQIQPKITSDFISHFIHHPSILYARGVDGHQSDLLSAAYLPGAQETQESFGLVQ